MAWLRCSRRSARGVLVAGLACLSAGVSLRCSESPGTVGPTTDASSGADVAGSPLVSEAGFLSLLPQATAARYAARMFYSFRPADTAPAEKPLLIVFDGGPGGATSANLLVYGTGPMTLDPDAGAPHPNPGSFTRFANLLYLDERQTGFSYGLGPASDSASTCTFSVLDDAADYVRAISEFLAAHPLLSNAKVVLVGESYGGTRATAILHLAESAGEQAVEMPSDVRAALRDHASQFGQAVLIQPFLAADQHLAQLALVPSDPYVAVDAGVCQLDGGGGGLDTYDVQKPCGWSFGLEARAGLALANASASMALLGVDLGTVPELLPPARTAAFRTVGARPDPAESTFTARFGALGPDDTYWTALNPTCPGYDAWDDAEPQTWLYPVLLRSRLFVTNARYDPVVYSPAIPYMLETYGQTPATIDTANDAGVARPGWIHVSIPTDAGTATVEIRFPPYDSSGHLVAVTQGADLAADVEAWLAASP